MQKSRTESLVEDEETPIPAPIHAAFSNVASTDNFAFMRLNGSMSSLSLDGRSTMSPFVESLLMPPINRMTLKELDFHNVESNVQIMHDLYLEPQLRIQPNKKLRDALPDQTYWDQITEDVVSLVSSIKVGKCGQCPGRLRVLLKEIRQIMIEIHPNSKTIKTVLDDHFDMDLLVSSLESGQFDLKVFGNLFADLIQENCAPKRDKLVVILRALAIRNDFVGYLKQSLKLLEIMKMDLVNHHLSQLRPKLGDTLANMERHYFLGNQICFEDTSAWLESTEKQISAKGLKGDELVYATFAHGLVDLVVGCGVKLEALPESFLFDEGRLSKMRTEAQDLCITALILSIQQQFIGKMPEKEEARKGLKEKISDLLDKEEAEVSELTAVMLANLEKWGGRAVPANQVKIIASMVDAVLQPESPAYAVMERRLSEHLLSCLGACGASNTSAFAGLESELKEFVDGFMLMARLNWVVHRDTYSKLLS